MRFKNTKSLRTDPEKLRNWQRRSRQRAIDRQRVTLATGKSVKRSGIRQRRQSKKRTVDGDSGRTIKDEMDQLVRDIIKLRDGQCFTCPATDDLHVGHLFRRGIESTKWNLRNNHAQCDPCNGVHEYEPEHYIGAFIQRYGEQEYSHLRAVSQKSHKLSYVELIEIRDNLRAELEKLRSI